MRLTLNVTPIFYRMIQAVSTDEYHVYVFEGGSRSSKTYSLIQYFIQYALSSEKSNRIVVSRKKATWLYATVWHDFNRILLEMGISGMVRTNKSLHTIQIKNTIFEFVGLDDTQRLHGLTCDIFWINEAMEASKDDFDQLEQRCAKFAVLDYNPTAEEHWIYDNVCSRNDCYFDHSTMLDNPFIPDNMKRKILSYEPTEENYSNGTVDIRKWKIYGLGERAKIEGLIYEYKIVPEMPMWVKKKWIGIDFGFANDETAIEVVGYHNNNLYIDEYCYQTQMLNSDIINVLKRMPSLKIWADSAEPKTIREIHNAGFPIFAARKGAGSIIDGIHFMQGLNIYITERSVNAKRELDNYTWQQDKTGRWLNIPVDAFNHILDSTRYVVYNELMGKKDKDGSRTDVSIFSH